MKKKAGKHNSKLDDYSLKYNLIDNIDISKNKNSNEYYHQYMSKYKKNRFMFKLEQFYGFNFLAFILGPVFYMYSGLFAGLFSTLLITMLVIQFLTYFSPFVFNFIPYFLMSNLICGFFANYFIILKAESNFEKSTKYTKSIPLLIEYTEKLNTKFKFLNIIMAIPYSIFLFYFFLYISNPVYFLHPIQSFFEINTLIDGGFNEAIYNQPVE